MVRSLCLGENDKLEYGPTFQAEVRSESVGRECELPQEERVAPRPAPSPPAPKPLAISHQGPLTILIYVAIYAFIIFEHGVVGKALVFQGHQVRRKAGCRPVSLGLINPKGCTVLYSLQSTFASFELM